MQVLNFYSTIFADQLKRGRKTATIRLGDKSHKYRKNQAILVTIGYQHSPREKIFDAVVDAVDVKRVSDLSPRDIEHDNPEFRRVDETVHFLEQIYGREVKRVKELSPRDIEHDNPEFRRTEELVHFMEQIYGRDVSLEDTVTVVRFSAILERPSEMADRLRPEAPAQN